MYYTPCIIKGFLDLTIRECFFLKVDSELDAVDLAGPHFDGDSYRMTTLTATTYLVKALGNSSGCSNASSVAGIIRTIDQAGDLASE